MVYLPIIVSIFSLIFAYFLITEIRKASSGSGKQIEIQKTIREGVIAFLKRQYKTSGIFAVLLFFLLWLVLGLKVAFGFLIGVVAAGISILVSVLVSTQANLKVVEAANSGMEPAFNLSFKSGSAVGFLVVGLGLLSVFGFYLLIPDFSALISLCFGASLMAVFARLGGGIYNWAVDVGVNLSGKLEKGISAYDPRNPAAIADQVSHHLWNCSGMAGDMFQTSVITLVTAMLLGNLIFPNLPQAIFLPLILASLAILAAIISTFFVKLGKKQNIMATFYKGLIGVGVLSAIGFFLIILQAGPYLKFSPNSLYLSALIGFLIAAGIFLAIDFFVSKKYGIVKSVALISQPYPGQNIIAGLVAGMRSAIWLAIFISLGILISFELAGIYGLAITLTAILSFLSLIIALNCYGPITDNASGIAEIAGLPEELRKNTAALGTFGNITKAITEGYAIASAGLTGLVLFSAYTQKLLDLGKKVQFLLEDPRVLVGLFFGGVIVYYFISLAIIGIGKTANKMAEELRRQFREIPGLTEGRVQPEYSKCLDIVAKTTLKETILPAFLPVIFPILVGFIFGPEALGGLLIGSIMVGIFLAVKMTFGGGIGDNRDIAGSAISPMIKLLNIVALLIVSF